MSEHHTNCILSPEQYNYLWRTSWFSLVGAFYAYYTGYYDFIIFPGGVFLTSINYWRKPDYSWRRYLDIAFAHYAMSHQFIKAYNCENARLHYLIMFFSALCFPVGVYYYNKKNFWASTYIHSLIHIFGNVANIVLYSGKKY